MEARQSNPFSHSASKICTVVEIRTDLSKETRDQVNLVSISLNNVRAHLEPQKNGKDFPEDHIIYTYNKETSDFLFDHFKRTLLFAAEDYNADIICINELGMPLDENGLVHSEAVKFAKEIANNHNCLIIAGTAHCKDTYLNKGYLFFPGKESKGLDYINFYKNVSATNEKERIFTPSKRKIFITKAFGLGIAAVICLEVADFSSAAQIVNYKKHIDLLLVPTYLEDYGVMGKVAKSMSIPLGGVLLNNCFQGEDESNSRLYINGSVYNDPAVQRTILDNKSLIVLRQINPIGFLNNKEETARAFPANIVDLYGINDLTDRG